MPRTSAQELLEKIEAEQQKRESQRAKPQEGKQTDFFNCDADITLFGGSAGSGKSFAMLVDFARHELISNPNYNAVIFRRTKEQIKNEGGLWDESTKIYPMLGGQPFVSRLEWRFPSGATIRFSHLEYDKDKFSWDGSQVPRIGYDECHHFLFSQWTYLLSRNRSAYIRPQIRMTCNPMADHWLAKMIRWWIDDDGYPIKERSGIVRYFVIQNEEFVWADNPDDLKTIIREQIPEEYLHLADDLELEPKSFTFIPGTIFDNPALLRTNPQYLVNLMSLHPVERDRLLKGNWKVRFMAGTVFNSLWFSIASEKPTEGVRVRYWDLAATPQELAKPGHFYTAGILMNRHPSGIYYIESMRAEQVSPGEVPKLIAQQASLDGYDVRIRWELEPGSNSRIAEDSIINLLEGYDAHGVPSSGSKVLRAIPVATAASQGKVSVLKGDFSTTFLNSVVQFDGSKKPLINDIVDATSGAYSVLQNIDNAVDEFEAWLS